MTPYDNDLRISAYLDGELSAAEQTRFEQQMAGDAELRTLVEELRSLRGDLELLPRHKLGPDFAQSVLRRAEREVLAPAAATATASKVAASQPPAEKPARPRDNSAPDDSYLSTPWNWRRMSRPAAWAAVAVAAALLISIVNHDKPRDLARNDIPKNPASDPTKTEPGVKPRDAQIAASRQPNTAPAKSQTSELAKTLPEASKSPDAAKSPDPAKNIDKQKLVKDSGADRSDFAGAKDDARSKDVVQTNEPAAPGVNQPAGGGQPETTGRNRSGSGARLSAGMPAGVVARSNNGNVKETLSPGDNTARGLADAGDGSKKRADKADSLVEGGLSSARRKAADPARFGLPAVLVAECRPPGSAGGEAFRKLLVKNNIVLDDSSSRDLSELRRAAKPDEDRVARDDAAQKAGKGPATGGGSGVNGVGDDAKPGADGLVADQTQRPVALSAPANQPAVGKAGVAPADVPAAVTYAKSALATADDNTEVIYVEGSARQVLRLMEDVRSQPQFFGLLEVKAAAAENFDDGLSEAPQNLRQRVADRRAENAAAADRALDRVASGAEAPAAVEAPAAADAENVAGFGAGRGGAQGGGAAAGPGSPAAPVAPAAPGAIAEHPPTADAGGAVTAKNFEKGAPGKGLAQSAQAPKPAASAPAREHKKLASDKAADTKAADAKPDDDKLADKSGREQDQPSAVEKNAAAPLPASDAAPPIEASHDAIVKLQNRGLEDEAVQPGEGPEPETAGRAWRLRSVPLDQLKSASPSDSLEKQLSLFRHSVRPPEPDPIAPAASAGETRFAEQAPPGAINGAADKPAAVKNDDVSEQKPADKKAEAASANRLAHERSSSAQPKQGADAPTGGSLPAEAPSLVVAPTGVPPLPGPAAKTPAEPKRAAISRAETEEGAEPPARLRAIFLLRREAPAKK